MLRKIFESIENYFKQAVPTGVMLSFAGVEAPSAEWLLCDGAAVSRSLYPALFAQVGTAFGVGDGSTTFNVPDLRGRVPVVLDNLGGTDAARLSVANTLGATGGAQTHTLTTPEIPAHQHTQTLSGPTTTVVPAAGSGAIGTTVNGLSGSAGGGGTHNNMQPYLLVGAIIKV